MLSPTRRKNSLDSQSAFCTHSAICSLHFVPSPHFVSGLQSAVCILWMDALFPPVFTSHFLCLSRFSCTQYAHRKPKCSKARCQYYSNSSATRQLLLMGGDISRNPGPIKQSANGNKTEDTNWVSGRANRSCKTQRQKCLNCEKTIRCNQKQTSCCVCFSLYHIKCVSVAELSHTDWSCSNCLMSHLPFFKCSTEEILNNDYGHQSLSPQVNPPRFSDLSDIVATLRNRPSNLQLCIWTLNQWSPPSISSCSQ